MAPADFGRLFHVFGSPFCPTDQLAGRFQEGPPRGLPGQLLRRGRLRAAEEVAARRRARRFRQTRALSVRALLRGLPRRLGEFRILGRRRQLRRAVLCVHVQVENRLLIETESVPKACQQFFLFIAAIIPRIGFHFPKVFDQTYV